MTTATEIAKVVMTVSPISKEDLFEANKAYNASEWQRKLDGYNKFQNVKFFKLDREPKDTYDKFYAVYTIPEGITLFAEVDYSSCLSNNGFVRIEIVAGQITRFLMNGANGACGRIENNDANRKLMAKHSKEKGFIWSNEF